MIGKERKTAIPPHEILFTCSRIEFNADIFFFFCYLENDSNIVFGLDVWSIGCILFELTALRVPFDAYDLPNLARKIQQSPCPIHLIPSLYSKQLKDMISRMLSKRPKVSSFKCGNQMNKGESLHLCSNICKKERKRKKNVSFHVKFNL